MEPSRRLGVFLAIAVCAAGLGCDQPLAPQRPQRSPPPPLDPPSALVAATVAGQVTDADSGQPVGGAVVTVEAVQIATTRGEVYSPDGVGTSTVADSGEFRLEPIVRANWVWILLNVRRDGYEPTSEWFTQTFSPATPIDELVLAVYPTLIVRPGESIQTRVHLRSYTCGSEPSRCRRILIESAPGEPVEVELVPPTGPNRGLEPYDSFQFAEYKRRVTVSNGEVYVIGEHDDSSPVTLTVRRP